MDPSQAFSGQTILVTGAGGYIGSALAQSLGDSGAASLVLLDSSEQNLFELQRKMDRLSKVACRTVLGSVEDAALLEELFSDHRPEIVFHAAAFKHVELLESNPFAAIRNNVLGTHRLIKTTLRHGAKSLILVSTDKAVLPRSIMGVSKRIAERLTVSYSHPGCRMNVIRLCNVLGSTGSVLPIFEEQIARGGPITVTDTNATRYFVSLDEAVSAIHTAALCPLEGRVLLPGFEPPVRIMDIARNLIGTRASIEIQITGLRPGEKLREEWLAPGEVPDSSLVLPLTALRTPRLSAVECDIEIDNLARCLADRSIPALLEMLRFLVPDYTPSLLLDERAAVSVQV